MLKLVRLFHIIKVFLYKEKFKGRIYKKKRELFDFISYIIKFWKLEDFFCLYILMSLKPPGSCLDLISSDVLTLIKYKPTNQQTNKHAHKPTVYEVTWTMYCIFFLWSRTWKPQAAYSPVQLFMYTLRVQLKCSIRCLLSMYSKGDQYWN